MNPKLSRVSRGILLPVAAGAVSLLVGGSILAPTALYASDPMPAVVNTLSNLVSQPLSPAENDVPDEQPSPAHVWIPGHWHWSQGSYVWVAGHWEVPPVPNATWVAPEWQQQGSDFALREGFWQQTGVAQAMQPAEVSSTQPPPPARAETIPERPSGAHVWLPGYWDFRDNQFRWVDGHWEVPPKSDMTWVPTHWESRDNRYVLLPGFWRENPPAPAPAPVVTAPPPASSPVVVVPEPPPVRTEVVYPRPSPFHVWVPGYWRWYGGRYIWIAGHWERPPHGRGYWVEPRWERRGDRYVFIEGHWR